MTNNNNFKDMVLYVLTGTLIVSMVSFMTFMIIKDFLNDEAKTPETEVVSYQSTTKIYKNKYSGRLEKQEEKMTESLEGLCNLLDYQPKRQVAYTDDECIEFLTSWMTILSLSEGNADYIIYNVAFIELSYYLLDNHLIMSNEVAEVYINLLEQISSTMM